MIVVNGLYQLYNCDCVSAPNVGHILFECPIVDTIRKEQWQNVVREMPIGMANSVNTMAVNEKVIYIYTCFNGVAIKEWINIYKAVIEFIQVVSKLWYEKIESRDTWI